MSCTWIEREGQHATEPQWEAHISNCKDCRNILDSESEGISGGPELEYYRSEVALPHGIADVVMEKLGPVNDLVGTRRRNHPSAGRRWVPYVGAAALMLAGVTFHAPVAHAMAYVIDRIHTSFFADTPNSMAVNVTQVTPEQKKQVEQDLLSPSEHAAASVFAQHKAKIVAAYKQLNEGQSHALRFADGTAFLVSRQSVLLNLDAMRAKSTIGVPVPTSLPLGLAFDEGSVRMSGMGTETAELNMIFTEGGHVKQNSQFEYQKYTDPSYTLGKGNFLSVNVQWADGILGTDFIGDFDLKKTVTVQGQPGVLMKYKDTWQAAPGIVRLSFGVTRNGHHYTVLMDTRGLTPDQLLQVAQGMAWEK